LVEARRALEDLGDVVGGLGDVLELPRAILARVEARGGAAQEGELALRDGQLQGDGLVRLGRLAEERERALDVAPGGRSARDRRWARDRPAVLQVQLREALRRRAPHPGREDEIGGA